MQRILKSLWILAIAFPALAQIPAPQINLTGNIGCVGFPCLNSGTLIMSADADRTMTALETSAMFLKVTSSVSLTATRNLISPTGTFPYTIENATAGGQSIQIIGTTGTGVTIANGTTVAVWNDGTNFVQIGSAATGAVLTSPSGAQTITYNTNGANSLTLTNPNAGAGASTDLFLSNGTNLLSLGMTGTGSGTPNVAVIANTTPHGLLTLQAGPGSSTLGPVSISGSSTTLGGAFNFGTDSGAANAYVVTVPQLVTSEIVDGTIVSFSTAHPSTGASTLSVAGVSGNLVKNGSTALTTGDILASPAIYDVKYDGANWQLLNSSLTGSSLPTASTGQMLTNTSGSTTYAGQANIFYQQSGDTIASIEAACSSACTYVVTSPQTITLAASHAMSSNVFVRFEAQGKWNVTGAFTLSNVQVAPGTTTSPHFSLASSAVVKLGSFNSQVPVEWFGAVADWNGTTGTNNLTAIQNTINAITFGQAVLSGAYAIGGTLTYTASYVGMKGFPVGRGINAELVETVAGDDAIDVHGTSGSYLAFNKFQDFTIASSVAQTGTPAGLSLSFTGGVIVINVTSNDFFYPFYIHASPSYGGGGFYSDTFNWSSLSSAMSSPVGFYLYSGDGYAENSLTIRDSGGSISGGGPSTAIGMLLYGTAVNDVDTWNFATAGLSIGQKVNYTGSCSGTANSNSDIHFIDSTHDSFTTSGYVIQNLNALCAGSLEISGGWVHNTNPQTPQISISSSSGVSVNHVLIGTFENPSTNAATRGIVATSSSNISLQGNQIMNMLNPIYFTSVTNSIVNGNVLTNNGTILGNSGIALFSSTYNTLTANNIGGPGGYSGQGIYLDASSNYNVDATNTCGSTTTTCITDSGTGNGLPGPVDINLLGTGSASFGNLLAPNLAVGNFVNQAFGALASTGNSLTPGFHYAGPGSASNYYGVNFYGVALNNYNLWPNSSMTFGQTTPSPGPAGGIGVGTTQQFQVSGAGAVTAPSYNGTLLLTGATSTITGTALTATCDSGTATVSGAVVGHPVAVSSTTGADVGGAFNLRGSVTSTNTVTVYVCGTGTPSSLAYNVVVF